MNTELRTKAKDDSEKDIFNMVKNSVFGKSMEDVKKHRDIKLVTNDRRKCQLVLDPNCYTTKWISKYRLLPIRKNKKVIRLMKDE